MADVSSPGVILAKASAFTAVLGSKFGGIGASYNVWTVTGRVLWPF